MCFLFPWPKLCPSNFFAKQLKLYHMEINILMYTVRLEHKSFRPIFGLLLSTTVDIVSLFFTHAKFLHQHKYNFEVLIVTLNVFQHWPFLWQWGQYARKLPHFIHQQCPCDYSEDYILSDTENISMPVLYVKNEVTQIHLITVKTTKKSSNKLVLMSLKTNDITCRLPFIIKDCDGTSCLYFFLKEIWNVSCKW